MAQSVKCPTLGFGSGHDLTVRGIKPRVRLLLSAHSLLGILFPFFSAPLLLMHALSLSQNKLIKTWGRLGGSGG